MSKIHSGIIFSEDFIAIFVCFYYFIYYDKVLISSSGLFIFFAVRKDCYEKTTIIYNDYLTVIYAFCFFRIRPQRLGSYLSHFVLVLHFRGYKLISILK